MAMAGDTRNMPDEDHIDSPLTEEDQEIGAKIANDETAFYSVISDYYRGEMNQASRAQDRIDQTTNWAITVLVALLSLTFSSRDMPAFLLLIGIIAFCLFLWIEVRRYRFYDLYRARTRLLQENFYANTLQPVGILHSRWREELSDDLRYPTFKVTTHEALSRRVHRIYGLLFAVLGVGWVAKVTLFTPETQWTEAAELPGIPGITVAGILVIFYLCLLVIALWPAQREAKGEIYREEPGDWKNN